MSKKSSNLGCNHALIYGMHNQIQILNISYRYFGVVKVRIQQSDIERAPDNRENSLKFTSSGKTLSFCKNLSNCFNILDGKETCCLLFLLPEGSLELLSELKTKPHVRAPYAMTTSWFKLFSRRIEFMNRTTWNGKEF